MRLQPADYRAEWERILPGVLSALEHQKEGLRPEDVFFELRAKQAFLYTCPDGFLILKKFRDERADADVLLIWMAYMDAHGESAIQKYKDELEVLAKEAGCKEMQLVSTRRGYEKVLPEGWECVHTRWRKRLS